MGIANLRTSPPEFQFTLLALILSHHSLTLNTSRQTDEGRNKLNEFGSGGIYFQLKTCWDRKIYLNFISCTPHTYQISFKKA